MFFLSVGVSVCMFVSVCVGGGGEKAGQVVVIGKCGTGVGCTQERDFR